MEGETIQRREANSEPSEMCLMLNLNMGTYLCVPPYLRTGACYIVCIKFQINFNRV